MTSAVPTKAKEPVPKQQITAFCSEREADTVGSTGGRTSSESEPTPTNSPFTECAVPHGDGRTVRGGGGSIIPPRPHGSKTSSHGSGPKTAGSIHRPELFCIAR